MIRNRLKLTWSAMVTTLSFKFEVSPTYENKNEMIQRQNDMCKVELFSRRFFLTYVRSVCLIVRRDLDGDWVKKRKRKKKRKSIFFFLLLLSNMDSQIINSSGLQLDRQSNTWLNLFCLEPALFCQVTLC